MLSLSLYGLLAFSYIGFKILNSLRYSPSTSDRARPRVSVIIPEYNEDPCLFERGLRSVFGQDYPIEEVWVVDDGSTDTRAWNVAQRLAAEFDTLHVHRFDENQGKREAQAYAFERAPGDVFVTMDLDTVLDAGALAELVRPLADERVMATTGYPKIVNKEANLLTKLIDMRYWVAFNVERASKSTFGLVTCCCGVLSAYRADMIREVSDDYTSQMFLGRKCTFGDDRWLTSAALRRGRVEYQSLAVAQTAAPESMRTYIKQQIRWMRSFWRESLLALTWSWRRSLGLTVMLLFDILLPFLLVTIGAGAALTTRVPTHPEYLLVLAAVVALVAYVRNVRYARRDPATYALSPGYGAFYLVFLLPLSFYALVTMRRTGWGTR